MTAPTLIVGVGGIGGRIVGRIASRIEREHVRDVELVVMDTDVNDLKSLRAAHPSIYIVQTSPQGTVGKALDHNKAAREKWFPLNDGLVGKPFSEGAGQVRAVSRLAFDYAVEQGYMENLEKAIAKLHGLSGETMRQEMRVIITGSIAGGTGSGLVLPVAMYIRNFLISRYQDNSAIIRGFFLEPDVLFGRLVDEDERNRQRANAYAAIREIDAFFRKEYAGTSKKYAHVVFNAPQPGLGERIDYPNILPYHFVFLMDALNANGDSLTDAEGRYDFEGYQQHAADCIYTQTLSPLSGRSNSSEDNVILMLAANNGRSRYCGAGSSCLEYPKDIVQRYIALSWAEKDISGKWLEIDEHFKQRRRDEPNSTQTLAEFYRDEYKSRIDSNDPFYKSIAASSEIKDDKGQPIDKVIDYVETLKQHAENWVSGTNVDDGLYTRSVTLRHCAFDNGKERLQSLPTTEDEIRSLFADDSDAISTIQSAISIYYQDATQLALVAQQEVPEIARNAARSSFYISEYDDNPLKQRDKDWHVESVFAKADGHEFGTYHPAAVRFMLYRLMEELKNESDAAFSKIDTAKKGIQNAREDDYYSGNEQSVEKPDQAVSLIASEEDDSKRIKLPFLKGDELDASQMQKLADICSRLNMYGESIKEYITNAAIYAFMEAALSYVKSLAESYEDFYSHLESQLGRIHAELTAIELSRKLNDSKGSAHRYVCANRKCLAEMKRICVPKTSSGSLPVELCGDVYNKLLKYSKMRATIEDYDERSSISSEVFDELFQSTVIDYWKSGVMDPHIGYPDVIDKSIGRAIADEALYTSDVYFSDDKKRSDYILNYSLNVLDEEEHIATPFIEPPVGEMPRHIKAAACSVDAFRDTGSYGDVVHDVLVNSHAAIEVDAKDFSPYEILFYSSLYGFCADNLPKYAPAHKGYEDRPEGEYHRAYYALVNQLSPNLKENKVITPHIDRNWHLACALPDLNEEFERSLQYDIVHAFLFGLIYQQFDAESRVDSDDRFYIRAGRKRPKTDLWVSNGTACDKFYELFDALKLSPPAVNLLLSINADRVARTRDNGGISRRIGNCELVDRVRSHAFDGGKIYSAAEIRDAITRFSEYGLEKAGIIMPYALSKGSFDPQRGRFSKEIATNLFGNGDISESRTSIFEIPLLYRLTLPQCDYREGEIDRMIECIFDIVEASIADYSDDLSLDSNCSRFFEEQYMLFEYNLIGYEGLFPNVATSPVVNAVREKVIGYFEDSGVDPEMQKKQNEIRGAWERSRTFA